MKKIFLEDAPDLEIFLRQNSNSRRITLRISALDGKITIKPGDKKLIPIGISLSIPKGAVVGIIGANGAGKSTLFRLLSKIEEPDSGQVDIGETVKIAYVEQSRETLDDDRTVWQAISDGYDLIQVGNYEVSSRAYVGRFNFKGTDQQKLVKELSGGERGRLHLSLIHI